MHAIALALAVSLALGPAATQASPAPAPTDALAPTAAPAPTAEEPVEDASPEAAAVAAPTTSENEAASVVEPEADVPEADVDPEPAPAPAAAEAEPPHAHAHAGPPVVRDRLGCDGAKRCRRMTVAGIVVGVLGFGGVGTGIGLLVNPDKVVPEAPVFVTSTRPAGLVMLTVSSGVAFTAILMLVAAHKGYKDRPERARIQLTPSGLRF